MLARVGLREEGAVGGVLEKKPPPDGSHLFWGLLLLSLPPNKSLRRTDTVRYRKGKKGSHFPPPLPHMETKLIPFE